MRIYLFVQPRRKFGTLCGYQLRAPRYPLNDLLDRALGFRNLVVGEELLDVGRFSHRRNFPVRQQRRGRQTPGRSFSENHPSASEAIPTRTRRLHGDLVEFDLRGVEHDARGRLLQRDDNPFRPGESRSLQIWRDSDVVVAGSDVAGEAQARAKSVPPKLANRAKADEARITVTINP